MINKPAYTIAGQIALLKQRGMLFRDESVAQTYLANINYYRLNASLFDNTTKTANGKTLYQNAYDSLLSEIDRSQEVFVREHFTLYPNHPADAWKVLEVASMGTLSKLFKSLKNHLPEKAIIANEMGINSPPIFSGWLESIVCIRNIIAHHSRLWGYTMNKTPAVNLNRPAGQWLIKPLTEIQKKKPFLIISCMIYLCNIISPGHHIKAMIFELIKSYPSVPIYKLGFLNNWQNEPVWK